MFPPYRHKVNLHVISLNDVVSVKEYRRLEKKSKRQTLALGLATGIIAFMVKKYVVDLKENDNK
jgi:hypothetical protein